MALPGEAGALHPRLALFARSQAPFIASVVIAGIVSLALGISPPRPGWLGAGLVVVALATLAALALPWERYPVPAQAVLAAADLVGVVLLSVALAGAIDTVAVLAAVPATWAAVAVPVWGPIGGIVGATAAALLPPVLTAADATAWGTALVIPVVLSVLVVGAVLLVAEVRQTSARERTLRDERNAAEAERERLSAVMQSFADEIEMGLVFLDVRGGPPLFNDTILDFGRIAAYDPEVEAGTRVYAADQVTPVPAADQAIPRLRRGETVTDFLHWVGPRGGQRALLANGRAVHRADGRSVGSMLVVQDITELLRAERAREDALATLAHELRTPLTSIVGYTELLEAQVLPPAAAARIRVIGRNAEELLTLTAAFLDGLHRPPTVEPGPVAARELVEEILDALPGVATREVELLIDDDLVLFADRDGIGAVLANLLDNAVKFSREGDRVRVSAGSCGAEVWLTVHNSGSRIEASDLERVFDRFYRGMNAQRDAVAGTGIGLSISRDIVHAHGGTLTADPIDQGACVRMTLPAAA